MIPVSWYLSSLVRCGAEYWLRSLKPLPPPTTENTFQVSPLLPPLKYLGAILLGIIGSLAVYSPLWLFRILLRTFQSGFLSILYSIGSQPLQIWDKKCRNGHIKRITDNDIQSSVLEIMGTNVSTTFIQCPADPKKVLGIKLPFLVMIIKNVSIFWLPSSFWKLTISQS